MSTKALNDTKVQIVKWIGECDTENVFDPMTYRQAMREFKWLAKNRPALLAKFDIVSVETGRLVSWAI